MSLLRRYSFLLAIFTALLPWSVVAEEIAFDRDIRPILSDRCYFCHGPDEENRQADLRFDTPEGGQHAFESGEFLARIRSDDPDMRMPPPSTKLELTAQEKDLLQQWVESGAKYAGHWAFEPLPPSVPLPEVQKQDWPRQPLDRFVLAKLEAEQLEPSPEAGPLRWLRRVTFDLTGLPPTIEEIQAFRLALQAGGEAAYESTVDRLLASPAYGEHMAVPWLDAARYADSYGYQSDQLNTLWPYRDWVARAFNENLPYDQFLTWQLAGDLLDEPTQDQRLATAFNRLHRLTNEGGAVAEEWRIENVSDRVHTFGTAVLGLTLECTRCHDHKYDPITMRDYYALGSFFNSIDESGLYNHSTIVPSPSMLLPTAEQAEQLEQAKSKVAESQAALAEVEGSAENRRETWLTTLEDKPLEIPDQLVALDFDSPPEGEQTELYHPVSGNSAPTDALKLVAVEDCSVPRMQPASGERRALVLDGERGMAIEGVETLDRWSPFTVVLTLRETQRHSEPTVLAQQTRGTDVGFSGWDLLLVDGHVQSRLYRHWPGNAIAVETEEAIPADKWQQLTASYDGSSSANGLKLYLDGKLLATRAMRDQLLKSANPEIPHGGKFVVGQRFRDRGFAGGLVDDLRIYSRQLSRTEIKHLATGQPIQPTLEYFCTAVDKACRSARQELRNARFAYVWAEESVQEVPVMAELPEPRPAHVLARGNYDAPTSDETLVSRHTFEQIGPDFPSDAPRDRLGLARWLTANDHPLTARVFINRLWVNFFGAGLVRTPENFGLQGELPTHPELLDWLARDFVEHDWDMKRMCRNIALSATYRQDSAATAEIIARDPTNRLLARGPAYRLDAEEIRDLALAAAGLLSQKLGGPPVSPYQPGKDLWKESNAMSPPYRQSEGDGLYRRSLYSVWKRTAPLPNMSTFDSPSREVCTVSRSRTNTPLQALVLLNDVQFVEAARVLAEQLMKTYDTSDSRISAAFLTLTGRLPESREQELLQQLLEDERIYYREQPAEAEKLLALGEKKRKESLATDELAALTTVCQAIMNLDATIWTR